MHSPAAAATEFDADATLRPVHAELGPSWQTLPRIDVTARSGADLQLLSVLGEGGMGQVHLARQRGLDRDVAVKMINRKARVDATASLLMQEGLITGRLEHPNIVPVHLMGIDGAGDPVIAMKRIEGVPWSRLGVGDARTAVWAADPVLKHLEIFLEVCNAVAFAHDRGYVHRDIKPDNVMIGRFGEVYLLDWGISVPIGTGAFDHVAGNGPLEPLGTPLFLAPEQCLPGGVLNERTDVFLLGATLHRMLTGKARHAGRDLTTVLANASACPPFAYGDQIPDELAQILNKATARDPGERYASASELHWAVAAYLRHRSSIELAREAEQMLLRLEQIHQLGGQRAELRRTCTECRFAFMRALRDWPGNARAARGLQRCLEVMTRIELDLGQLEAAQALIEEMPQPSALLQAELEAARSRKAADDEQLASLRRMAHELDPTVSKLPRTVLGIVFILLVVGLMSGAYYELPILDHTPRAALVAILPFLAVYAVALIGLRRRLLATLLNRRWMILVGMALAGMALNRCLAIVADAPFAYMLGVDLFLIALIVASAATTMYRMLYVPAAIWSLGFVGIVLLPGMALPVYAVAQVGGLVALTLIFYFRRAWIDAQVGK